VGVSRFVAAVLSESLNLEYELLIWA